MSSQQPTFRDYWYDVKIMAEHVIDTVCEYDADPMDTVHATVDGSEWVIYYYRARFTLLHSRNEDALFELGADLSGVDSMGEIRTRAAYHALFADVCEELHYRRYDVSDGADEWRAVRDDSGEE